MTRLRYLACVAAAAALAVVLASCGDPPQQYPDPPARTSNPGSPEGASGPAEEVLAEAMPQPGDWDELGVELSEDVVDALPEVELVPAESVPDPCDSSGVTKLDGAPAWTEGRGGVASVKAKGQPLRLTHRVWRFETPAEAEEALAVVAERARSCGPVSRGAEWNESFVPVPEPGRRQVRYRWDLQVESVARQVSVGWTSEMNSLVMVEVRSLGESPEPDVETELGAVAGRVLRQEVNLAVLPPTEDQDA